MNDAGFILAGYLVTAATVATYAWSIRSRSRRVARTLAVGPDPDALGPNALGTDVPSTPVDEG